jgi:hypothetical protein
MADFPNFVSNQGSSPWVISTPGQGLIRHEIKKQGKAELLNEAAALGPDSEKLSQTLFTNKLSPGDLANAQKNLQGMLSDYIGKYNDSPYYAFSREGRETVRRAQLFVNHPLFKEAEVANDVTNQYFKKANDVDKNGSKFNVVNGQVSVFDQEDRQFKLVPFSEIKLTEDKKGYDRYVPLTVNAEKGLRDEKGYLDFKNGQVDKPMEYSMSKYEDAIKQINDVIGTPGTMEYTKFQKDITDLNSMVGQKYKTNTKGLRMKLDAIMSSAGLSQEHKDVMLSTAFQNRLNEALQSGGTGKVDGEQVYRDVAQTIQAIVMGEESISSEERISPYAVAGRMAKAGADERLADMNPWVRSVTTQDNPGSINLSGYGASTDKRDLSIPVNEVPRKYLDMSKSFYKDDDDAKYPKRNIEDMRIFEIAKKDELFVPDLNTGKPVRVPKEFQRLFGEMVVSNNYLKDTLTQTDENGNLTLPGQGGKGDPRNTFMVEAQILADNATLIEPGIYDEFHKWIESLGYRKKEMSSTDFNEYKLNTQKGDVPTGTRGLIPGVPWNEYRFPILAPYDLAQTQDFDKNPVGYQAKSDFTHQGATLPANSDLTSGNPFGSNAALGLFDGLNLLGEQ